MLFNVSPFIILLFLVLHRMNFSLKSTKVIPVIQKVNRKTFLGKKLKVNNRNGGALVYLLFIPLDRITLVTS